MNSCNNTYFVLIQSNISISFQTALNCSLLNAAPCNDQVLFSKLLQLIQNLSGSMISSNCPFSISYHQLSTLKLTCHLLLSARSPFDPLAFLLSLRVNKAHVISPCQQQQQKKVLFIAFPDSFHKFQCGSLHCSTINLFLKSLFLTFLELPNPQENFLLILR